jgi:AcrR family transcriptional regulator
MNEPKQDPRITRTRNLLRQALMELVTETSFSSLTIQDVTSRAGLNRSTFYLHYSGLHELLEDCARELFGRMRAEIYQHPSRLDLPSPARYEPFVQSVFNHLQEYETFYRAMLGTRGDSFFRSLFQELLTELIFEPIRDGAIAGERSSRLELAKRFYSAGFTGIATWWLESGRPISAAEASRQITRDLLPDYLRIINI